MPTTAGILSIVAYATNLILGIAVATFGGIVGGLSGFLVLGIIDTPLIILGVVAIIGGIFALTARTCGMEFIRATCWPIWSLSTLGILAAIFVGLSKQEFT